MQHATELAVTALGAWLVPYVGMRMLVPALETSSRQVENYRGRRVVLGLGAVWVFWAVGLTAGSIITSLSLGPDTWPAMAPATALVLLTFVFGLIDDFFGSSADKGLRGHISALLRGRLTTGGLKMLGIGVVALWTAGATAFARGQAQGWSSAQVVVALVAGTVLIAGTANLLNLLDLRPGRALKSYVVLFTLAFMCSVAANLRSDSYEAIVDHLALVLQFLGPVVAVWRFDLGERGMLGDGGANPAGALVGFLFLTVLPVWGVVAAALIVTALNLASERVSFTRVIEGNRLLAWIDGLDRLAETAVTGSPGGSSAGPPPIRRKDG